MRVIDADELKAEIERLEHENCMNGGEHFCMRRAICLGNLRNIITSPYHEHPEVELDFQAFSNEMNTVFNLPKEITENTEENPLNWEYAIARHFYELGRKAKEDEQ